MLEKVDLFGCAEWDPKDQQEARKILREYVGVSAKDDLNLGWPSVVKHKIALKEGANLIKEHCRRVPPGLYVEVQKHLQEMIDIWAIQPSNSPWASAIVLVRKKEWENFIFVSISGNWILWWLRMPILFQEFKIHWNVYKVKFGSLSWT